MLRCSRNAESCRCSDTNHWSISHRACGKNGRSASASAWYIALNGFRSALSCFASACACGDMAMVDDSAQSAGRALQQLFEANVFSYTQAKSRRAPCMSKCTASPSLLMLHCNLSTLHPEKKR